MNNPYNLNDLQRVMERLRDPATGCPWDIKQDFKSIVPSTLEECYELAHAIEQEDYPHVAEELGDVLFQVIFYSQLGSEEGLFTLDSVIDTLVSKLIRRHPHVFANAEIEGLVDEKVSVDDVKQTWESIKEAERKEKSLAGVLADVPVALPALPRAQKLQKRAARVGFDWSDPLEVLDKLEEEVAELRAAFSAGDETAVVDELGDVLFTSVNMARQLDRDAESVLRQASGKFERRFMHMERTAATRKEHFADLSQGEMEELWHLAKSSETD
ncbi:MAG: nucleoside triphosphate pyrophosphohydrolase [Halioglobus sp.]